MADLVTVEVKGEPNDGLIIFGVVLVNTVISLVQESRAEKAIEALAQAMATEATVIRSGEIHRIPAADLVPGDMRLVRSRDL